MVSIAMATYNGEKYLKEQLDSLLNQTYSDLEIIICDDCSHDSTSQILHEYAEKDSRIKLFFNEKNLGFKKNFEKAISLCNGEYIALSDQDDIWELNKIETELNAIGNNDFVFHNAELIAGNDIPLNKTAWELYHFSDEPKDANDVFRRLIPPQGNFVQGSTMLAKTDFIKGCLPIPEGFKYHDWWFALNSTLHNGFIGLSDCLIKYRRYAEQITATKTNEDKKYLFFKNTSWFSDIWEKAEKNLHLFSIIQELPLDSKRAKIVHDLQKYYKHTQINYVDFYVFIYFAVHYKDFFPNQKSALKKYEAIFHKFCSMIGWFIFRPHLRSLQREYAESIRNAENLNKEQNMEIAK